MRALTVFLAPAGPAHGVLDVLTDLSAAGLVDPFLWVSSSHVGTDPVDAVEVIGGRRRRTALGDAVVDQEHAEVRLCVIVPVSTSDEPVPVRTEQHVSEIVSFSGSSASVTRVRCIVARSGSSAPVDVLARSGWHNILIAPEEAHGPGRSRQALGPSEDPVEIGRHAAPVVAGVIGLWTGVDACPLGPHTEPGVRAARAFYRRIDASAVEQELRERVLATQPQLPLPRTWGGRTVYLDDSASACRDMAERLWERNHRLLVTPRVPPKRTPVVEQNWSTLLRWFFKFLKAAVSNLPADWWRAQKAQQAVRMAERVHRLVVGDDGAYRVVVNNVTRENLPAGWRDVGAATARMDEGLVAAGLMQHPPNVELAMLWEDYRNGAFSLLDAGDRPGMPSQQLADGRRGVLRSAADCVPDHRQDFNEVPPHTAALVDVHRVQAGDVLGGLLLRDRLEYIGRQHPAHSLAAGSAVRALAHWMTVQESSYSVQVGRRIAGALLRTIDDIRADLDVLRRAAAEQDTVADGDRAFSRWVRFLGVLAVLGIITGPVLRFSEVVNTAAAVLIAVVPLIAWIVFVAINFMRKQAQMFREMNRRQTLLDQVDAAQVNLRAGLVDLRRLQIAYDQYLVWSRIVGEVLGRPYGDAPDPGEAATRIARGLPRTTRVAQALVDKAAVGEAAGALQAELFVAGWLGPLWDRHVADAPVRLGLHDLVQNPAGVLDLHGGRVAESRLAAWADLLVREGTARSIGDDAWSRLMPLLFRTRQDGAPGAAVPTELGARLLSSVRGVEDGDHRPVALAEFLAGVDQAAEQARSQEFAPAHFTAEARTQERTRIAWHEPRESRVGLSRVLTLVQLGQAWPAAEFAVARAPATVRRDRPEPPPLPPDPAPAPEPWPDRAGATARRPASDPHVPPAPDGFA